MCRGLKEGGDSWGIAVEWNSGDLVRVWRRELGEVKEKMGVGGGAAWRGCREWDGSWEQEFRA